MIPIDPAQTWNESGCGGQPSEPRAAHAKPIQRHGSADLRVRPLGIHPKTPATMGREQPWTGPAPISAGHPTEHAIRPGPDPGWRGGGPLCPLPWAFIRKHPSRWAENRPGSAWPRLRWVSLRAHHPPGAGSRTAGGRTSVSAPMDIHPKTSAPMGREQTRIGQAPHQPTAAPTVCEGPRATTQPAQRANNSSYGPRGSRNGWPVGPDDRPFGPAIHAQISPDLGRKSSIDIAPHASRPIHQQRP